MCFTFQFKFSFLFICSGNATDVIVRYTYGTKIEKMSIKIKRHNFLSVTAVKVNHSIRISFTSAEYEHQLSAIQNNLRFRKYNEFGQQFNIQMH